MFGTQVFRVSPSIWCVRRPSYLTCSYLVVTPGGTVMVDAGMDSGGADMRAGLAAAGLAFDSVRAILLTHWHNDHAAGGWAMRELTGAPVYYHRGDLPFFTRETAHPGLRGRLSDLVPEWGLFVLLKGLLGEATPKAVTADRHVADGDVLLDSFEVIETPGHTPGHVCYYYRPERALFAGDALAVIGGQARLMSRPVTPDLGAARASVVKCLSREIDLLCPGHREPLTRETGRRCRELARLAASRAPWPLFG